MKIKSILLSTLFFLGLILPQQSFAQIRRSSTTAAFAKGISYKLPFSGDNLKPGERVYTGNHTAGIQALGEDFGVRRYLGNNKWSGLKSGGSKSKNGDYLIYGKRIYAMAAGKIVGCWCNAPNNPKPPAKHPKLASKEMPGGGNMLWVEHSDGTRALYAHMIPGSMPANLCANKSTYYPKPIGPGESSSKYVTLPVSKQVNIKKGQFLGKVGNSGNSTGPHLHAHLEKNGAAAPMRFENGLYKVAPNGQTNLENWSSLKGKTIPNGQVYLWPARKVGKEYARHGVPAKDFPRLFKHLADSGYAPEWIDGYSVGNKVFYNFIWRKSTGSWLAYFGLSGASYQQKINAAKAKGLYPTQVESYKYGNSVRYAIIFKKVPGAWKAYHGQSAAQHQNTFNSLKSSGYAIENASVVSINGTRTYTTLYRKKNVGAWVLKSQLTTAQYQAAVTANKAKGRKPVYVATYMHNGAAHFSAIFAQKPGGSWMAKHNKTSGAYQTDYSSALKAGYLTRVISGYDGAQANHRFTAVWRK